MSKTTKVYPGVCGATSKWDSGGFFSAGYIPTDHGVVGWWQGGGPNDGGAMKLTFVHKGRCHFQDRKGTYSRRSLVRFAKQFASEVAKARAAGGKT